MTFPSRRGRCVYLCRRVIFSTALLLVFATVSDRANENTPDASADTRPSAATTAATTAGDRARLDRLRDEIRRHDDLYYNKAASEISDADAGMTESS